jgi:hypothetical protein
MKRYIAYNFLLNVVVRGVNFTDNYRNGKYLRPDAFYALGYFIKKINLIVLQASPDRQIQAKGQ